MSGTKETINGRDYTFGVIPPEEALRVEVAIGRAIGPGLFAAFMDSKKTGMTKEQQRSAGMAAIGMMSSSMDADELIKTMKTVFNYVAAFGKPRIEISDFVGRNKELWQVFIAALRVNFSDFLPENLLPSLQDQALQ